MAQIQPPETFDFSTPNEWPKWRKRFERYLVVSGMKKKEEADKIDLFMYLMGDRADDIFRTFKFEKEEEATKIDSVLKAFDSHFCVRKNIIYERAKFNSRIQEDREPVDEFITSLYKLADSCEFEGLHEQLIRDRIVVGVRDKALSERMQLDSELTLEKAVKMVRQQEAVRQQQVDLQRPSTSQKVNQVKFNSKNFSPKQQQQPSRKKEKSAKTRSRCPKCGSFTHREGQACRAEGQKCNLCSKTGHFANCCPDKQAKTAEVKAVSELDEEIGFLLEVSAVEDSSNLDDDESECRRRWTAEIQVNGKRVKFKLDSQADVTCVPLSLFKKIMGQQRLVKSDINIRAAEFSELQTVGMFISTLRDGNYEIKEKIYVIRRLSEPLLSRRACELLNLARRIEVVATRINPIKEFPEVFEGLGQIGNPYEIKLKPGAKPYAVHTPRRVPIPLMEKLKTRLEELERAGIIAQVNVATEWCAPTVIAGKPNGDIRLCVDLSRLKEHVQREVHPMPVVEHMLGQLGEARFFSKLDANSGFHQIPLSPDCQHLTTFITPFGRYKYCRMPFGISLAPEYFQRVMSIILQGMDGVMCYLDDILIFASDSKTHDRILRLVLRKLKEAKVTLNKAKCVFGVPRINFLGHILDEDGIRPDPAKIEAVARMPAPTDVHGVRRFLGMVNHLGRKLRTTLPIAPENLNPRLVDSQTLKRKEGRRRKDMKSRYDRRCGATDMEELSEGDTVWITDMRTWGIVKQRASTPRSYMVDTPVGTLRRNRFHLRKGVTVQYPADPSTPTFSGEELVENEKTPVVEYPSNDSEDGQIRTRKVPRYHRLPRPKSRQDRGRQGTSKQVDHCLYRKMEQGREEDPKEPMEFDPNYESGENTTFPKLENTLGRTEEVPPSHEGATPPPAVSDVLGRLTRTLHQLSAVTRLSRDVELPRYDGSYEAQSFFTNYDAQADRAQLQYSKRLRKPANLLQAPLRVTNTRAMKFLVALTLLALGSQCLARPTNNDDHHWERFKELNGKNYQGLEEQVRKAIFEEKLKKIVQHNLEYDLGMHSYYLGINKYSDWSSQEFTERMNGLIISENRTMDLYEPSGDMELPSSLDWRSKGYVTEVKDQGYCGSCWAFSTTGGLEGQHYRKTGKLVSLSEQNLVDCSTKTHGCNGGYMRDAFEYIMKNGGINTEESYPYMGYTDNCHYNKSNIGATCKGYKRINQDEESLKQALAAVGPISIAIDASGNFQEYKGGVYNNPDCGNAIGSLNHGVLLVGYGQENGMDYWLVKNSWGDSWGENGYIKMSRNKNNQCGIANDASYPIV
ncbi:hypothetical protein LAZ67_1002894 [Cordylochernes scorpioides]|uniref:Reverse transcriptase domain-containing protein n=1 Tax=Cordylochernes scorpioides TaxID=51811 RepID=A0ABY6JZ66_9ARAC|nr:hypothetical protein LAZ67_1002894 [Cordylochernes scorpioides]